MHSLFATLAAALLFSNAQAQDTGHSHHSSGPAAPAKPSATSAQTPAKTGGYRSAFSDYRPFSEEVPAKGWRRANDEVRDVGGHAGLMKGEPAQLKGHGSHGAKQPTPPATDKK